MKRYEEEKLAHEMYYEECKEDTAMELYDAHVATKNALDIYEQDKRKKINLIDRIFKPE